MSYEEQRAVRVGQLHSHTLSILKKNYGRVLLVTFLVMVLIFVVSLLFTPLILGFQFGTVYYAGYAYANVESWIDFLALLLPIYAGILLLSIMIQAATEPIRAGQRLYMLNLVECRAGSVEQIFSPFKRFFRFVGCYLWILLWTSLWSLLFIVPGIIKYLSYSMTPYLVLQYDNLTIREAMDLSKRITEGYKGQIFLMHLIILGWALILVLPMFMVYFIPYAHVLPFIIIMLQLLYLAYMFLWFVPLVSVFDATMYNRIKQVAFARGTLNAQNLKIFANEDIVQTP